MSRLHKMCGVDWSAGSKSTAFKRLCGALRLDAGAACGVHNCVMQNRWWWQGLKRKSVMFDTKAGNSWKQAVGRRVVPAQPGC